MSRVTGLRLLIFAIAFVGLSASYANAQPEKAEAVLAEAKALAAGESFESRNASLEKFDEAAALFRDAGLPDRERAVDLAHAQTLRGLGVSTMNAGQFTVSRLYFEKAIAKATAIGNHLETAYSYHDLGFISSQDRSKTTETLQFYARAFENYRAAGDTNGEAGILRNIGVVNHNAKQYAEALKHYFAAMEIRVARKERNLEAELLVDIGDAYAAEKRDGEAVQNYQKAARTFEELRLLKNAGWAFYKEADLHSTRYRNAYALTALSKARENFQKAGELGALGDAVSLTGRVHAQGARFTEADRWYADAITLFRQVKNRDSEGWAELGRAHNLGSLDRYSEMRTSAERAYEIFQETKNDFGRAAALLAQSDVNAFYDQFDEALRKINDAKKIFDQADPDRAEQRVSLSLASYYYSTANHGEAIRILMRTVRFAEAEKDDATLAQAYMSLGNSYSALANEPLAIDYAAKAHVIFERLGNHFMGSAALNNIGYSHFKLKNYSQAQSFLERAIAIMRKEGYERSDGYATHNLGLVHYARKEYDVALKNYDYALAMYRKTGDRRPESFLYDSYGELYRDLGQFDKALENLQKAILLARAIRYSAIEAQALANMMTLWERQKQPRLAVLYGKQAVNIHQGIRALNKGLEKSDQKKMLQATEKTYRQLANILIEEGRLAEAQDVLEMLKDEEVFEYVRRDAEEASKLAARVDLRAEESEALKRYQGFADKLSSIGAEFGSLQEKKNRLPEGQSLAAPEQKRYDELAKQLEEANTAFQVFLRQLADEFAKKPSVVSDVQENAGLQADLKSWGQGVVALYTVSGDQRYRVILTTPEVQVDGKSEIKAADLNKKIAAFRAAIQNPKVDPRPLGKELYDIIVKPIESQLEGAKAKTLLWSLDGSLRYLPIAALWDGKQYFGQKYQNVLITLASRTRLSDTPATNWRILGLGVTGAKEVTEPNGGEKVSFSALPSVATELKSIVRDEVAADEMGVLSGKRLLDAEFTEQALKDRLGKGYKAVHIASHFSFRPGDITRSFLLLGDGRALTMDKVKSSPQLRFTGVELLTLSACDTAVGEPDAAGKEIESFAVIAQQNGAKAVLATLWPVADESTQMLMTEFYRLKKENPDMTKSEAIQMAQRGMLDGKLKASGKDSGCRGPKVFGASGGAAEFKCDPNAPFTHPYFWAPFVLIGNWR
jgi:CHAT domain-containing protein/tetratricopeptide (TPR) repeat protein